MRRMHSVPATLLVGTLSCGLVVAGCSGSGGNSFTSAIVQAQLKNASTADLSGSSDAFVGTLGSGASFTFPAVKGQTYIIDATTTKPNDDQIVIEVAGADGSGLRSKTIDKQNNFSMAYKHEVQSQHVLVVVRPRDPFDTKIQITKLRVTGQGTFPENRVHLNVFVTGTFNGLGLNGDLVDPAARGAFTNALMAKVQNYYQQTGISLSFEGFSYTPDQVKAVNPGLVLSDGRTVCSAGESMSSSGFSNVDSGGLDQWGALGFAANDANFDRGHGIDVFVVHHFSKDGTVGLSPRPGTIPGNGAGTALCVGAFLQSGNTFIPRTLDEMAVVLAHEIGHFLGLLHTTTFSPDTSHPTEAIDDGLTDTPKCDILTDVNKDGRVGIGDGCPDENNIMFYQAGQQTIFTPGQSGVMKKVLSVQEH